MNATAKILPVLERAEGRLDIRVQNRGHGNALAHLMQDGCLKARFPKMHDDGPKRGVLINTTGGITDGDQLASTIQVEDQAALVLTSQAAERIYKAANPANPAQMQTRMLVGKQASLFWLPQETILFEGGAIHRKFDLDIADGGTFLGAEMMVLGRTAMQETVTHCNLFDRWRIRVGGKLAFADGFRLSGHLKETAASPAALAGNIAYATCFYIGAGLETLQSALREILEDQPPTITAGSSIRGPVLICRVAAKDQRQLANLLGKIILAADNHINESHSVTQEILKRWVF